MKLNLSLFIAAAITVVCVGSLPAAAQTDITFSNLAVTGGPALAQDAGVSYGSSIAESGFTITAPALVSVVNNIWYFDYLGSVAIWGDPGPMVFTPTAGGTFSLETMDVANEWEQGE